MYNIYMSATIDKPKKFRLKASDVIMVVLSLVIITGMVYLIVKLAN